MVSTGRLGSVLLVGAVAFAASCGGMSDDGGGSGGAGGTATGGTAATGGASSGGGASATGGATEVGGQAGAAGGSGLPGCGCREEAFIKVEFPEGERTYDRIAVHGDGCNPLTCEPEAPYAVRRGAPPTRQSMRACSASGECVRIEAPPLQSPSVTGTLVIENGDEVTFEQEVVLEGGRALDVPDPRIEFSFETVEGDVGLVGSGSLCWADSEYICLK